MLKTSNVEVICVCFAGCYLMLPQQRTATSKQRLAPQRRRLIAARRNKSARHVSGLAGKLTLTGSSDSQLVWEETWAHFSRKPSSLLNCTTPCAYYLMPMVQSQTTQATSASGLRFRLRPNFSLSTQQSIDHYGYQLCLKMIGFGLFILVYRQLSTPTLHMDTDNSSHSQTIYQLTILLTN